MAALTAQQIAAKWQQGMAQAGQAFATGTAGVTESPMAKAAAQAQKAAANYANSVNSGQWAAALNAVPLSFWKSQCAGAAAKLASGATKGLPKYTAAVQKLIPVYAAMRSAADAAPDNPVAKFSAANALMVAAGKKGQAAS